RGEYDQRLLVEAGKGLPGDASQLDCQLLEPSEAPLGFGEPILALTGGAHRGNVERANAVDDFPEAFHGVSQCSLQLARLPLRVRPPALGSVANTLERGDRDGPFQPSPGRWHALCILGCRRSLRKRPQEAGSWVLSLGSFWVSSLVFWLVR